MMRMVLATFVLGLLMLPFAVLSGHIDLAQLIVMLLILLRLVVWDEW